MLDAIFRPLNKWPAGKMRDSWQRKAAQFRAKYSQTLDRLERELEFLRAKDIVIEAGFDRASIRNDGWPKSSARPAHPAIIVSFSSPKGPLSFPCDRYTNWEDNLRAIALSLEALRAVDRYGVTREAEQYQGWKQLPAAGDRGAMNAQQAAAMIAGLAGVDASVILRHKPTFDEAYRIAARKAHPDTGGNHELFVALQAARGVLLGSVHAD